MTLSSNSPNHVTSTNSFNHSIASDFLNTQNTLDVPQQSSAIELTGDEPDPTAEATPWRKLIKKVRGGLFVAIGYLLSPLCWWNDLIFNLPIAYAVGVICNAVIPHSFFGGAIAGYWLSNVVGILMMQFGTAEMIKQEEKPHNFQKTLWTGLLSSTAYTIVIVALVQFGILTLPEGLTFQD